MSAGSAMPAACPVYSRSLRMVELQVRTAAFATPRNDAADRSKYVNASRSDGLERAGRPRSRARSPWLFPRGRYGERPGPPLPPAPGLPHFGATAPLSMGRFPGRRAGGTPAVPGSPDPSLPPAPGLPHFRATAPLPVAPTLLPNHGPMAENPAPVPKRATIHSGSGFGEIPLP